MGAKKGDMADHIDNFINNDADTQIATKEPAPSVTARSRSWPWGEGLFINLSSALSKDGLAH